MNEKTQRGRSIDGARRWRVALGLGAILGLGGLGAGCSEETDSEAVRAYQSECEDACRAEDATGCALVALDACLRLCALAVDRISGECLPLATESLVCENEVGVVCNSFQLASSADPERCKPQADALRDCQGPCEGADEDGFCPSVECACPGGPTRISGFDNSSGQCRCLSAETCAEFC